ncbi:hypothetical protein NIES2104_01170 [Leptolyngbya sp. NIES-2104]|nr:hypothetical protein NIES2104_01170 [Leptolyngbya sp. NIES-2104]
MGDMTSNSERNAGIVTSKASDSTFSKTLLCLVLLEEFDIYVATLIEF